MVMNTKGEKKEKKGDEYDLHSNQAKVLVLLAANGILS